MPDKKSSETDNNPADSGKGSKRLLPAAALCIVLLGGGYFVGTMTAGGSSGAPVAEATDGPTDEAAEAEHEEKAELGHLEALDAVNVNLQDGHFLRVAVTLELGEYDAGGGHGKDAAEFPTAPAADLVLTTFSGRTMAELGTAEGRELARTQLLDAVVAKYGDKVVSLYFTEFVMQ